MTKTPTKPKKAPVKTVAEPTSEAPRQLKKPTYKSFRLSKRIKGEKLPGAPRILVRALRVLGRHWKVFLAIAVIYGLLNAILVQGFNAAGNLGDTKSTLDQLFSGNLGKLATSFTLFVYLLGSSGNTVNSTAGAYQLILSLIVSLALIWALRQIYAGNKAGIRESFYRGMAPLIPFVLVLLVVILQLVPMILGMTIFGMVAANNLAANTLEQVTTGLLAFLLAVLSLYMVSSSAFAMYIVTLPGMTPMKALRSARQLVMHRRWATIRKVLFLPVVLVVVAALLIMPIIMLSTVVAPWAFFVFTLALLPIAHSYMYALYRSML